MNAPEDDPREGIRDRMLERASGLARATRYMLLNQRKWFGREAKIPPALYFDSAETPPTFLGLASETDVEGVRSQVRTLMRNANTDKPS